MNDGYIGKDRREFLRYDYERPLHYSTITTTSDKNLISKLIGAVAKNLSGTGILFTAKSAEVPEISSLIILDLDYKTARVCQEIDTRALILNNKLLGRVVRIEDNENGMCDIGVAFITKSESLSHDIKSLINKKGDE